MQPSLMSYLAIIFGAFLIGFTGILFKLADVSPATDRDMGAITLPTVTEPEPVHVPVVTYRSTTNLETGVKTTTKFVDGESTYSTSKNTQLDMQQKRANDNRLSTKIAA